MDLISHSLSPEFSPIGKLAQGFQPEQEALIAFRDSQQFSLTIRATAFAFQYSRIPIQWSTTRK